MKLTRRQQEIYDFLRNNRDLFAQPPTLDELCQALGLRSRGSLYKHVQALVDAGLVEPMAGKRRGIRLVADEAAEEGIPFLGYIAAGQPIEAIPQPESMLVPPQLAPAGSCFVLQVRGESMIEEGIFDGDWVVIEQRETARNGEIVVALIGEGEATLKRIEQRPDRIILHPANRTMQPIICQPDDVRIQGVLVGLMRRY